MSNLLYYLRRHMPDSLATWAMRNRLVRRALKSLLVTKDSRIDVSVGEGCVLRLHPSLHRDLWYYRWESQNSETLKRLIKPGDVVWDVGAHVGYYTVQFAKWVGSRGRVVAFEPFPENFEYLEENCRINQIQDRVRLMRAAASSLCGRGRLVGGGSFTHHLAELSQSVEPGADMAVETVALDDFLLEYEESPPSVVKIDVEGHEGKVLHGMRAMLKHHGAKVILEVHNRNAAIECKQVLEKVGYSVFALGSDSPLDLLNQSYTCWVLCKKAH